MSGIQSGDIPNRLMKTYTREIVLNILLIGLWTFLFFLLFYNAIEERILDDSISRYLGVLILLFTLIHIAFVTVYAIKAMIRKQYFKSVVFLLMAVSLVFTTRMGGFVTMIYFGGGAVGGH